MYKYIIFALPDSFFDCQSYLKLVSDDEFLWNLIKS